MRRTYGELVEIAARTPRDAPVGLTQYEVGVFERAVNVHFDTDLMLMGRRVVVIPWDWMTRW